MTSIALHPSELAYAFSWSKTETVVGWGSAPFLPGPEGGDANAWLLDGEARMIKAGRLVETEGKGGTFTEDLTSAILALIDPTFVLSAERKDGDRVLKMTVHVLGGDCIGLMRTGAGLFEMTRYGDITAAAAACSAFVGACMKTVDTPARIDANLEFLSKLREYASQGHEGPVAATLVKMGATEANANSATGALAAPVSAGVLSVFYCARNTVLDTEAFTVMTNASDETWVLFAPATPEGPMVLERSSVASLAARVSVGVAARFSSAAG